MGIMVDVEQLRKRYLIKAEIEAKWKASAEIEQIIRELKKYDIPEADYEARLKADMVAMLEEFDLRLSEYEDADLIRVGYIRQDIQQKINELKRG